RLVDAAELPPRHRQVTGLGRTAGEHYRVVVLLQLFDGDVHPDVHTGAEFGALGSHLPEAAVQPPLLHLELGDAVAQQSTDAVRALVDHHAVPGPGQLLGSGQSGRPGTDDGDLLPGPGLRQLRLDPTGFPSAVDGFELDLLDGDRIGVDADHAGGFAR